MVTLRKLELEGFRYYKDRFTVEFPPGITVIAGPVGSGKSSLLEAIEYGLFGTDFGLRRRMYSKEDLVNAQKGRLRVVLEIEAEDGVYLVERRYSLDEGEKVLLRTPDGEEFRRRGIVNEMIRELLGLDVIEYERTVYLNQVYLYLLAYGSPGVRSRVIDGLLGIDALERIASIIRRYSRVVGRRLEEKRSELRELIEELESVEEEARRQREENTIFERELESLRERLGELEEEAEELEKRIAELAGVEKEFFRLRGALEYLRREVRGPIPPVEELIGEIERSKNLLRTIFAELILEEKLKEVEELECSKENLRGCVEKLRSTLEEAWEIYNKRIESIKALNVEVERRRILLSELEKKILELEPLVDEYEKAEHRLEAIMREYGSDDELRRKLRELELESKKLEARQMENRCISFLRRRLRREVASKGKARCPVCGAEVDWEVEPLIVEEDYTVQALETKIAEIRKILDEIKSLKVKLVDYEEAVSQYKALLERREEILAEIDRLNAEIAQAEIRYKEIGSRLVDVERSLALVREALEKHSKAAEMAELEAKLEALQKQYSMLEHLRKKYKNIVNEKTEIEKRIMSLEAEIESLHSIESEIESLKSKLSQIEKEERALEDLQRKLDCAFKLYKSVQFKIRRNLVERISEYMRLILSRVYPYRDLEDVRLSVEEKEGKSVYTVEVKMNGEWSNFSARLSEGQKTVVILSLLLSFYKTVSHNVHFLLLDEPVPNVDIRVKESIFRGVSEVLGVKQVVFTTQSVDAAKKAGNIHVVELARREVA